MSALAQEYRHLALGSQAIWLSIMLQPPYYVSSTQLSIRYTLCISYNYLVAIIYKLVIIFKGCYTTITILQHKDTNLLLYSIGTMFYLTLFISHSHQTQYLSVGVMYFLGPSSCPANKGYPQPDVLDHETRLGHINPNVGPL